MASALKAAQQDRANLVGDPAYVDVPTERLTSKEHAAEWRERIDAGERISIPRRGPKEESSTIHLCVVDGEGNAARAPYNPSTTRKKLNRIASQEYSMCIDSFIRFLKFIRCSSVLASSHKALFGFKIE